MAHECHVDFRSISFRSRWIIAIHAHISSSTGIGTGMVQNEASELSLPGHIVLAKCTVFDSHWIGLCYGRDERWAMVSIIYFFDGHG